MKIEGLLDALTMLRTLWLLGENVAKDKLANIETIQKHKMTTAQVKAKLERNRPETGDRYAVPAAHPDPDERRRATGGH